MTMGNPELFGLQFVKGEKKKIHNLLSIKGLWFLLYAMIHVIPSFHGRENVRQFLVAGRLKWGCFFP